MPNLYCYSDNLIEQSIRIMKPLVHKNMGSVWEVRFNERAQEYFYNNAYVVFLRPCLINKYLTTMRGRPHFTACKPETSAQIIIRSSEHSGRI